MVRKHYTQVEGFIKEEEIQEIKNICKGKVCLEIDAIKGKESIVIAQVAEKLFVLVSKENSEEVKSNLEGYQNIQIVTGDVSNNLKAMQSKFFDVVCANSIYICDNQCDKLKKDGILLVMGENNE